MYWGSDGGNWKTKNRGDNGDFTLNTACLPPVPGTDACGNNSGSTDVWYWVVPICTGTMTLDTCTSGFDTVLSHHSGCPGSAASELACNDDCGGKPCSDPASCLCVPVTKRVWELYRVSGAGGNSGDFKTSVFRKSSTTTPLPAITAKGSAGAIELAKGKVLKIRVQLDPGAHQGVDSDWWVVVETPLGR